MRGLSLVAASGGHSSSRCAGLSLSGPLLLRSTGSRRAGSVVVAHGPICSAACGIFPDQGSRTRVPCIGRQILNHCATREAQDVLFCMKSKPSYRTSLVAQWLKICRPMQVTWARSPVWEDSTCCGSAGPMSHNY